MKTYNINPYFDDFSDNNNFYQILFKPGYAVQARELTQLQTILRDQIAKFGSSIYQHGSVVIPGNSFADLNVPCIKLQPATGVTASSFEGKTIRVSGETSGIKAYVKKAVDATSTDPLTLYLSYIDGGSASTSTFADGQVIQTTDNVTTSTTVTSNCAGIGSLAFINPGVFYIRGTFVHVDKQSVVLSKYTSTPSCRVLLQISETVVSSASDYTLLDPAQGTNNYAAPGADRVKIALTLTTLGLDVAVQDITDNYVELFRYDNGDLKENNQYPKYSELEKSLARRTFDESGDYIVSGFKPTVREHLKTPYNDGVFTDGDSSKFVVDVGPGKGYVNGFETEMVSNTRLVLDRARTAAHAKQKSVAIRQQYGSYFYVSNLKSLPDFSISQTVNLYNTSQTSGGTLVGTMQVVGIDYHTGNPNDSTAIYKLYYNNLTLNGSYTLSDVGSYRFGVSGGSGYILHRYDATASVALFSADETIHNIGSTRTAKVKYYDNSNASLYVYKHGDTVVLPVLGDFVTGASNATATIRFVENTVRSAPTQIPLFSVPVSPIKSLKNKDTNSYDAEYTVWKTFTITTDGSGNGQYGPIGDGVFVTPEAGVTVAVGPAGVVSLDKLSTSTTSTIIISGGPASVAVVVSTQVQKRNVHHKSKTLTTSSKTYTFSNETPVASITLSKADVLKITSIAASDGTDLTEYYSLDNGQTDYYYGLGKINLIKSLPFTSQTGVVLTINFQYFTHDTSGDYFSVDSYTNMAIDNIPTYRSPTTSAIYPLKNYVDFRPRVGDDGTFTSVGATGAKLNDTPVVDNFITTTAQYYVPRIDAVVLNQSREIMVVPGIPSSTPVKSKLPGNSIELFSLFVPAYTTSTSSIKVKKNKNVRFTMQDINKLQDRVANVEYFSTLNSTENSLVSYQIQDAATGLNRYKTGYLVDNFQNPFLISDYLNKYQRASFLSSTMGAAAETHDAPFVLNENSTNYQITGNTASLPYTEVPLISQLTSTRITNLNPFMVFAWTGSMTINPPSDSWVVTEDLPTIYNDVTNVITVTREERVEVPYIEEPVPAVAPVLSPVVPFPAVEYHETSPIDANDDETPVYYIPESSSTMQANITVDVQSDAPQHLQESVLTQPNTADTYGGMSGNGVSSSDGTSADGSGDGGSGGGDGGGAGGGGD